MEIITYPSAEAEMKISRITERGLDITGDACDAVEKILSEVRSRGDEAVMGYTRQFDAPGLALGDMIVKESEFEAAERMVDADFLKSLSVAADQIESFHRKQLRNSWITTARPGVMLGQIFNPVDAAGVYVPGAKGGLTPLVSSVLMGVIPAKIAGVGHVAMATPPTEGGGVSPYLLVAAQKTGVDVVYKMGSAWAIAGLAYGTKMVRKVDVIVGPGNIYVTLAKKMVAGIVGIDMIAGPSEILVIADKTAHPDFIAADLLSQAEHDPLASALLITDSKSLARAVHASVKKQLSDLHRSDIAEKSLADYGEIILVENMTAAVELANRIAPEHLELHMASPFEYLGRIRNAGAVFIGEYTPEPVGDYIAGPNHVLPTAGTARFSSALSVDTFIKQTSLIHYSKDAFLREAPEIMLLAHTEGLDAHAGSVNIRLKKG
jgi:histidinol dehydrogenase